MARNVIQEVCKISKTTNHSLLLNGNKADDIIFHLFSKHSNCSFRIHCNYKHSIRHFRIFSTDSKQHCKNVESPVSTKATTPDTNTYNKDAKRTYLNVAQPINAMTGTMIKDLEKYIYKGEMIIDERSPDFKLKPPGTHFHSGAVKRRPLTNKFRCVRAVLTAFMFMYLGGQLSSYGAYLLDEYEIFALPEDE